MYIAGLLTRICGEFAAPLSDKGMLPAEISHSNQKKSDMADWSSHNPRIPKTIPEGVASERLFWSHARVASPKWSLGYIEVDRLLTGHAGPRLILVEP